jgi:hypothetical protein
MDNNENKEINEKEIHTDQTDLDKKTENPAPNEPDIKLGTLKHEKEQVARAKKRKKIIRKIRKKDLYWITDFHSYHLYGHWFCRWRVCIK